METLVLDRARRVVNDFSADPRRPWGLSSSDKISFEEILIEHLRQFAKEVQLPAAGGGQ